MNDVKTSMAMHQNSARRTGVAPHLDQPLPAANLPAASHFTIYRTNA
jgi:hypothetical protein